jgi:UDP-N-acetylglucosamine pyrophosphorylase
MLAILFMPFDLFALKELHKYIPINNRNKEPSPLIKRYGNNQYSYKCQNDGKINH